MVCAPASVWIRTPPKSLWKRLSMKARVSCGSSLPEPLLCWSCDSKPAGVSGGPRADLCTIRGGRPVQACRRTLPSPGHALRAIPSRPFPWGLAPASPWDAVHSRAQGTSCCTEGAPGSRIRSTCPSSAGLSASASRCNCPWAGEIRLASTPVAGVVIGPGICITRSAVASASRSCGSSGLLTSSRAWMKGRMGRKKDPRSSLLDTNACRASCRVSCRGAVA